mgnify:CR=1 FL=1
MSCSHKTSCGMFPIISLSSALKIWQTFYCDGKYETCERYRRSIAGEPVPRTLLPNGKMLDVATGPEPAAACGAASSSPTSVAERPAAIATTPVNTTASTRSSYYLRFQSKDGQRALQHAAAKLQELAVGVDAGLRKPSGADGLQTCIVITDYAPEMDIYRAIVRIEDLEDVVGTVRSVRLDSAPAA